MIQAPSTELLDHAAHGTHRFVHVDGSHLYDVVVDDVRTARTLLAPQGLVVFDDYRSPHTPGVAAAVWQAVDDGFRPLWMTPAKLYGTWGDTEPWLDALSEFLPTSGLVDETQTIAGNTVHRLKAGKKMNRAMLTWEVRNILSSRLPARRSRRRRAAVAAR